MNFFYYENNYLTLWDEGLNSYDYLMIIRMVAFEESPNSGIIVLGYILSQYSKSLILNTVSTVLRYFRRKV